MAVLTMIRPGPLSPQEIVPLTVIGTEAHDARLYTQGLLFYDGYLYESSGLYGQSRIVKKRFPGGEIAASLKLPGEFFAEGAAAVCNEIYLLTWRENTLWVLDAETLAEKRRLTYQGEGWGLAFDGERLWRSDGTSRLYPHKISDFSPAGEPLEVAMDRLNELEWDPVNRLMLANIYGSDQVAAIDLTSGEVRAWLEARPVRKLAEKAGLKSDWRTFDTVLNGLALAPDGHSLWLTGKLWPAMYQVAWPPEGL
jgi:glutaminyl-peptide cyclotransferase